MAKDNDPLVEAQEVTKIDQDNKDRELRIQQYIKLVDIVRNSKSLEKSEEAFNKIVELMHTRMQQLSYKMRIPGCVPDDLYQEALIALKTKAIKDYDKTRSQRSTVSPFDHFAMLCIRRHLSTKLKSSFQSRQIVMNKAKSIDQDRSPNQDNDENISLSDIISTKNTDSLSSMEEQESYKNLLKDLWQRMSDLEKQVFIYHKSDLSYDDIAKKVYKKKKPTKSETKSIDNALSRIKMKAQWLYKQHYGND